MFAPQGRIFDTTGATAERPPSGDGWVEHFGELDMTPAQYADRVIERAVREELAKQGPHRGELEADHREKFGTMPHALATNEEVANVMDGKTADGSMPMKIPGMVKRKK